jgi:hypothetical protein
MIESVFADQLPFHFLLGSEIENLPSVNSEILENLKPAVKSVRGRGEEGFIQQQKPRFSTEKLLG